LSANGADKTESRESAGGSRGGLLTKDRLE
jgi:hypothetical protein